MRLSLHAKKSAEQRKCWTSLPTTGFFVESEREIAGNVVMECVVDPGHYRSIIDSVAAAGGRVEVLNLAVKGAAAAAVAVAAEAATAEQERGQRTNIIDVLKVVSLSRLELLSAVSVLGRDHASDRSLLDLLFLHFFSNAHDRTRAAILTESF